MTATAIYRRPRRRDKSPPKPELLVMRSPSAGAVLIGRFMIAMALSEACPVYSP